MDDLNVQNAKLEDSQKENFYKQEKSPNTRRDNFSHSSDHRLKGCLWGIGSFFMLVIGTISISVFFVFMLFSSFSKNVKGKTWGIPEGHKNKIKENVILQGSDNAKKIAVIDIEGIIMLQNNDYIPKGAQQTCSFIKNAMQDEKVVAVVLNMNTPGGEITASDEIHNAVMKLKQKKPVITCMRAVAASGGYYIAAGTDYIIANRMTITGSIGVIMNTVNYKELFNKIGLRMEVYKSGEMKDLLNGGRVRTEKEKKLLTELINQNYKEFVKIVAQGRKNLTEKQILESEIGDGRIFLGSEALKLGLVDQLGYFEDALNKAKQLANAPDAKVVRYAPKWGFGEFFFSLKSDISPFGAGLLNGKFKTMKADRFYYLQPSFGTK
ncbi:MAG: signal peptide peptidase SppA [Verrucomicrobiota bacterium]|nr:signal peptide peptidase SppA [Verrucomicrobiota bacterium]